MLSLTSCRCPFRLMRRCFLGKWQEVDLLISPVPFSVFWQILAMLYFGWFLLFFQFPTLPVTSPNIRGPFVCYILTPRPGLKMLFQDDTPKGSDTFQRPVIERDRVGGLRVMIWDKVKVSLCHYSHAPEESNLWTAWQLFPLDDY